MANTIKLKRGTTNPTTSHLEDGEVAINKSSGVMFYRDGDSVKQIKDDTKAATTHNHSAANITSGTLAIARIPTGTTSSSVAVGNHTHFPLTTIERETLPNMSWVRLGRLSNAKSRGNVAEIRLYDTYQASKNSGIKIDICSTYSTNTDVNPFTIFITNANDEGNNLFKKIRLLINLSVTSSQIYLDVLQDKENKNGNHFYYAPIFGFTPETPILDATIPEGYTAYEYDLIDGIYTNKPITAAGFVKEGESNSSVLLAGGGHRAVGDFALAGHTHSGYAPTQHHHYYIDNSERINPSSIYLQEGNNIHYELLTESCSTNYIIDDYAIYGTHQFVIKNNKPDTGNPQTDAVLKELVFVYDDTIVPILYISPSQMGNTSGGTQNNVSIKMQPQKFVAFSFYFNKPANIIVLTQHNEPNTNAIL